MRIRRRVVVIVLLLTISMAAVEGLPGEEISGQSVPRHLVPWLQHEQNWQRDTEGPVIRLGPQGRFDDTHIFAPLVAYEDQRYFMWYCGSTSTVAERVFDLGLAVSDDGRHWRRHSESPIYQFGDQKHSILTPTLLRNADGTLLREEGQLRMWFSSTWFAGGGGVHRLHETTAREPTRWAKPSAAQLEGVYAPTIIKENGAYRMWYTDVSADPWVIRRAVSDDGRIWSRDDEPCLVIDQDWERSRLFYPTVLKRGEVYCLWYGSYWSGRPSTTALGFAVSTDGKTWYKHPKNPVLTPDPTRPWESHYVTSQSIMPLPDGSLRIWYASRKKPPFVNKYFALNTAVWKRSSSSAAGR